MFGYKCTLQTDTEVITYIADYLLRRQGMSLEEAANVIAAPFWDLSFPALLKVYIEQVSVDGITFGSTESGLQGLCRASQLVFLTTRGGFYTGDAMEMGSRYLDALHTFFGIGAYTCIAADGMDVAGFDAAASLAAAIDRAKALARTF